MEESSVSIAPRPGTYLTPAFEDARVANAMWAGVLACPPEATMADVARMTATNHLYAVMVRGLAGGPPCGVGMHDAVGAAAANADDRLAGSSAAGQLVTAPADEHCEVAAELMRGHRVSDLMVVDPERNQPPGVISTLDVAGTVAGGRA